MSARKVMSIIGLGLIVLLIAFLFIPFVESRGDSESLWGTLRMLIGEEVSVVYLIELCVAIVFLILQICGVLKDTKLAMIPIGFAFTMNIAIFFLAINNNSLEFFKVGLYLNLITSIASVVILGIGGLLNNEKNPYAPKIAGYDPETGKPIYEKPKTIAGYNPQTGEPIYK